MLARRTMFGIATAILATWGLATAGQTEETLLTISGELDDAATVSLSDADLTALPTIEFETGTIWSEGVKTFSGPSLKSVLEHAGAGSGDLLLVAANDYKVSLPRDVVEDDYPIVANRIDGKPFGIREKGPLWVVFPYDSEARFQSELVYSYSVWQLIEIEVVKE